jgi:hypothetical protein
MLTSTHFFGKNTNEVNPTSTKRPIETIPFGINFEQMCLSEVEMAHTNTMDMNDDDSATCNKSTEDNDT